MYTLEDRERVATSDTRMIAKINVQNFFKKKLV